MYKLTIVLLFFSIALFSQPQNKLLNDVVMPSPTAAAAGKYADIPVSMATGSASFSIPIYQVAEGNLRLNISLSYHGSGLKVGEPASWVGAGWNLNAGGMITRSVRGIYDDDPDKGYYYEAQNLGVSFNQLQAAATGQLDAEPDVFNLNFNGYSGKFYLDGEGVGAEAVNFVPNQDLQVIPQFANSKIEGFIVLTPDGTRYIFGRYGSQLAVEDMNILLMAGKGISSQYYSTWYLVRVESADQAFAIDLTYEAEDYSYLYLASSFYQREFVNCGGSTSGDIGTGFTNSFDVPEIDQFVEGQRLVEIRTSTQKIAFVADTAREDLARYDVFVPLPKRLDHIKISEGQPNVLYCKQFDLAYDYFKDPSVDPNPYGKRLRLLSVQEKSCDQSILIPPYTFEYYTPTVNPDGSPYFPHRLSKRIDHWGFFNNASSNDFLPTLIPPTTVTGSNGDITYGEANRNSSEDAKIGVLTKINYPKGGYHDLTFGLNEIPGPVFGSKVPLLDITNCVTPTDALCCNMSTGIGNNLYTFAEGELPGAEFSLFLDDTRNYSGQNGCAPGVNYTMTIRVDAFNNQNNAFIGSASFNLVVQRDDPDFDPNDAFGFITKPLNDLETQGSFEAGIPYRFEIDVTNGKGNFSLDYRPVINNNTPVGGLRIERILSYDPINDLTVSRSYRYNLANDPLTSSGQLYVEPTYGYFVQDGGFYNNYYFSSSTIVPLGDFQGYHIGYTYVEEIRDGGGGKTSHSMRFRSVAPPIGYPITPYPPEFNNGVTDTVRSYRASNQVVAQSINGGFAFVKTSPGIAYTAFSKEYPCGSNTEIFVTYNAYPLRSGFYRTLNDQSILDDVQTTTTYTYDATNRHLQPTRMEMTDSDGTIYATDYRYPFDFSGDPVYDDMIDRNMIGMPIETQAYANGIRLKGSKTDYAFFYDNGTPTGSNQPFPRPRYYSDYKANADGTGGRYEQEGEVKAYWENGIAGKTGYPKAFRMDGWAYDETFDWENGQIKQRQFKDHTWTYDYHPNTRLVSKITDLDGQPIFYNYDQLMRLDTMLARPKNSSPNPANINDFNIVNTHDYIYPQTAGDPYYHRYRTDYSPDVTGNSSFRFTEVCAYTDGMGRPIQNVQRQHSPNELDVVVVQEYDNQGRLKRVYEPFESTANTGEYVPTIPSPANLAFIETRYFNSPLNRTRGTTPPQWNETLMDYGTNASNEVQNLAMGGFYAAGELNKQITTDPEGNQMVVFTDKRGKVILSRRDSTGNIAQTADTYTLYDLKERPTTIVPPAANLATSDLLFSYQYDEEDRTIAQKIPDKASINMQYDDRDILTAMQDGVMRDSSRWLVSILDDYGRTTQTGFFQNANANPNPNSPSINNGTLTKTFYDGGFGKDPAVEPIYYGKVRRTESAIMDGYRPTADLISTSFVFDDFGRTSNSFANNHLNLTNFGAESKNFSYDFADNLVFSVHNQTVNGNTTMVRERMTYDHKGRTKDAFHRVNMETEEHCSNTEYTVRDLVRKQKLGGLGNDEFLQVVDYSYNAQRWLTQINDVVLTPILGESSSTDPKDLFYLRLNYDNPDNDLNAPAQRNGNISNMRWQVIGEPINIYGFQYDFLDRLQQATYGTQNGGNKIVSEAYNSSYDYDLRGNVVGLTRNGKYDGNIQTIDSLSYGYVSASNGVQTITDDSPCPINLVIANNIEQSEDFRASQSITFKVGFSFSGTEDGTLTAKIDCSDNSKFTKGFIQRSSQAYEYDKNGSQKTDPNKGITTYYNHLNLPYQVIWDNGSKLQLLYTADGTKLQKVASRNTITLSKKDYLEELEYQSETLEAIYPTEGRVIPENDSFIYQYRIADHLGNTRVVFENNGSDVAQIISQSAYYPYGLTIDELSESAKSPSYEYGYNNKELQSDYNLGWNDFGNRYQDPATLRFTTIDRFAEKYASLTPFGYAANNPILFIDINGDSIFVNNIGDIMRNDNTDNLVFLQNKDGSLTQLGELGGEIDANEIYKNLLEKNIKEAESMVNPFAFKEKVRGKGEWDLKNDKESIFGLGNDGETIFTFQGEAMESQDLGNHHFGAVAKAYGWFPSEEFILKEAGKAQINAGTSKPEWQVYKEYKIMSRGGYYSTVKKMQPPYGDDPRDQKWIKSGFQYYKNKD